MLKHTLRRVAIACLPALVAVPAGAETLAGIVAAEFLPGWRTEKGSHMAAVRLRLAQGWKTYWRSPGDAGIPPEFDWNGSENLQAVRLHWPQPDVFDFNGMQTIGYVRELVLPVELVPGDASAPIHVEAQLDLGVCRDICIPARLEFDARLPASGANSADPVIRAALSARPKTAREGGVVAHGCRIEPLARGLRVTAEIEMQRLGPNETVVIETADPSVWVAEAQTRRDGNRITATTDLIPPGRQPFALNRSDLTLTVLAAGQAVEISGCPAR